MDTKSEQFREEMGAQWSNVTWRVTVPAKVSLWILAILDLEQEERQLRMDNPDIGSKWKEVEDKFSPQRNSIPQKKLLKNGDGRTFLAPLEIMRSLDCRLVLLAVV